jgi:hypothetical protein
MEDQDRETRIDEDVEGHSHKARNLGKDEETNDDVEAHTHKMRNLGKDDESDDVEGHMHKNAPHKGTHKL